MIIAFLDARRLPFAVIAAGCAALLAYGFHLQFVQFQEPCPMCILQRYFYMLAMLFCLAGAVHGARGRARAVHAALVAAASLGGGGVAARQVWLQHLPPDRVPECGPGLDFMLQIYPWHEAILKAFKGTGDCALVTWTFLGLSIAEWSLACFALMAAAAIGVALRSRGAARGP
ncbi:MAG: disulfide bond formation protein B [Gammaproteobacteria bacterium]